MATSTGPSPAGTLTAGMLASRGRRCSRGAARSSRRCRPVERLQDHLEGRLVGSRRRLRLDERGEGLVGRAGHDHHPRGFAGTALLADLGEPGERAVVVGRDVQLGTAAGEPELVDQHLRIGLVRNGDEQHAGDVERLVELLAVGRRGDVRLRGAVRGREWRGIDVGPRVGHDDRDRPRIVDELDVAGRDRRWRGGASRTGRGQDDRNRQQRHEQAAQAGPRCGHVQLLEDLRR